MYVGPIVIGASVGNTKELLVTQSNGIKMERVVDPVTDGKFVK